MKTTKRILYWMMATIGMAILVLACSKDSGANNGGDDGYGNGNGNGNGGGDIKTSDSIKLIANTTFGKVMTDGNGQTLYFFSIDANGNSGCLAGCTDLWPIYYAKVPKIGAGLAAKDFGTITRKDGAMQTTYKGWPLYYYSEDTKVNEVNGDGFGNKWFVAKADYSVLLANKTTDQAVQYLTDDHGNTLYAYSPDKSGTNNYTKSDFSNNPLWPIDTTVSTLGSIPSILKKEDFKIIQVFGKSQLTYKGWPLYFYGPDKGVRGDIKGESSLWPLLNKDSQAAPEG